ncbi:MAG: response regulator [Oligoflexales bacterium]
MSEESEQPTILIVDDEPDLRQVLAMQAECMGMNPVTASQGEEALEILMTRPPVDLILSDLMMPIMDGMRFLQEVRRQRFRLPFIFLTGYGNSKSSKSALEAGAYDFLEKPFEPDHMQHILDSALRTSMRDSLGVGRQPKDDSNESQNANLLLQSHSEQAGILKRTLEDHLQTLSSLEDLLTFATASTQSLDEETRRNEIGFLFRVMRQTWQESLQAGLFEVARLAYATFELYVSYRVDLHLLDSEEHVQNVVDSHNKILKLIKDLQDPSTAEGSNLSETARVQKIVEKTKS